jgi:hypothetical protein
MRTKPYPPVPGIGTLVVRPQIYGGRALFSGVDGPELFDAAHELSCGHLPVDACGCGDGR